MRLQKHFRSTLVAAGLLLAMNPAAHAATANGDFTVSATLTSVCQLQPASAGQTLSFGYTAFSASAVSETAPITLTFECTRGLAPTGVAFDTVNGTAAGIGVVAGLQYTLTAGAPTVTAGNAASNASIGTATTRAYQITGSMPAGQAGDSAAATSHTRTLILSY